MAGVQVGRVKAITLSNSFAEVTMNLDQTANVKTDSKASISFTGLMAQSFVAIDFGSPAAPRAAEDILLESVEQPDLGMLMTKLDNAASGVQNLTRSFSGEKDRQSARAIYRLPEEQPGQSHRYHQQYQNRF